MNWKETKDPLFQWMLAHPKAMDGWPTHVLYSDAERVSLLTRLRKHSCPFAVVMETDTGERKKDEDALLVAVGQIIQTIRQQRRADYIKRVGAV